MVHRERFCIDLCLIELLELSELLLLILTAVTFAAFNCHLGQCGIQMADESNCRCGQIIPDFAHKLFTIFLLFFVKFELVTIAALDQVLRVVVVDPTDSPFLEESQIGHLTGRSFQEFAFKTEIHLFLLQIKVFLIKFNLQNQ